MTEAYPLHWPEGVARTPPRRQERSRFKTTFGRAVDGLLGELRLYLLIRDAERVEIVRDGKGKYGRTLARVYADGQDVAEVLISEGLGRAYDGGKREGWCE